MITVNEEIKNMINAFKFECRKDTESFDFINRYNRSVNKYWFDLFFENYADKLYEVSDIILNGDNDFSDSFNIEFGYRCLEDQDVQAIVNKINSLGDLNKEDKREIIWLVLSYLVMDDNITKDQYQKFIDIESGVHIINSSEEEQKGMIAWFKTHIKVCDNAFDFANKITDIQYTKEEKEQDKKEEAKKEEKKPDPKPEQKKNTEQDKKEEAKKEEKKPDPKPEQKKNTEQADPEAVVAKPIILKDVVKFLSSMISDITTGMSVSYEQSGDLILMHVGDGKGLDNVYTVDPGICVGNGYNLLYAYPGVDGRMNNTFINIYKHKDIISKILHNPNYIFSTEEYAAVTADMLENTMIYKYVDFSGMKKHIININDDDKKILSDILSYIINDKGWVPDAPRFRFTKFKDAQNFTLISDKNVKTPISSIQQVDILDGYEVVVNDGKYVVNVPKTTK